jgi:hypothetical protein
VQIEYINQVYIGFGQQILPSSSNAENIKDMADFWRFRPN